MVIRERSMGSIYYDKKRKMYRIKVPIGRNPKTGSLKYKTKDCKTKLQAEKLIKKIQEVHNNGI